MGTISKPTKEFFEELKSSKESSLSNLLRFKDMKFGKSRKNLIHLIMKYVFDEETIKNLLKKLQILSLKHTEQNRRLPIHVACKYGNITGVKILLEFSEKSLKSKDFQGNSPLALSCLHEQHGILQILSRYPVNFLTRNKQGKNSIQIAMDSHNSVVVKELITGICLRKATFFKCLQFTLKNNLKEACSYLINELQPSDLQSFTILDSVLSCCRGRNELIECILEKISKSRMIKLIILLKLQVSSDVIVKYCKDEFFGNLIFIANVWNRVDLIEECFRCQLIHYEEVERASKARLKPDCQLVIKKYITWQKYRLPLFVRNFSNSIYSKIPGLVFREILEYL